MNTVLRAFNFPLGSDTRMPKPKPGLYGDDIADAVHSMTRATVQS